MSIRVPLWALLAAGLFALGLGVGRAAPPEQKPGEEQPAPSEYPYLPARYGEPYIPSVAEWQALRLTSLGCAQTRVTKNFIRQHLTCFPTPTGLALTLDMAPDPNWKLYLGGGKFDAPAEIVKPDLEEAIAVSVKFLRRFFEEVRDKDVTIRVFLNSESVGIVQDGKFLLNSEKPAEPGKQ